MATCSNQPDSIENPSGDPIDEQVPVEDQPEKPIEDDSASEASSDEGASSLGSFFDAPKGKKKKKLKDCNSYGVKAIAKASQETETKLVPSNRGCTVSEAATRFRERSETDGPSLQPSLAEQSRSSRTAWKLRASGSVVSTASSSSAMPRSNSMADEEEVNDLASLKKNRASSSSIWTGEKLVRSRENLLQASGVPCSEEQAIPPDVIGSCLRKVFFVEVTLRRLIFTRGIG